MQTEMQVETQVDSIIRANTAPGTHRAIVQTLQASTRPPALVLDIPCGEGALARKLVAAGYDLRASDIAAVYRLDRSCFSLADMNLPLPYADRSFDAVVSCEGIEHLERPFDFLREVARITRPEGAFVLSTPNISSLRSRWRHLLTGFHNKGKTPLDESSPSGEQHINLMSLPELRFALHSSGFEIERLACNRIKRIAWLYLPWVPFAWIATSIAFSRERPDRAKQSLDRAVRRQMFSAPVLFGESIVIAARRAR